MKKKLQKWLLLFFLISFCATSALTYVAQTKLAERTAVLTIRARINYLRYQIDEHEKSVESLSKKIKQILKEKATNLIVNLKSDPALAQDAAFLNTWRKNNELADLQIISPDPSESFLFSQTPSNLPRQDYTHLFSQGPLFLTEEPCDNKNGRELNAFAKWGPDNRFVRISFSCKKYETFMEDLSIEKLSENIQLDNYGSGSMVIARNGRLISDGNMGLTKQDIRDTGILYEIYKDDEFHRIWNKKSGIFHAKVNGEKTFFLLSALQKLHVSGNLF